MKPQERLVRPRDTPNPTPARKSAGEHCSHGTYSVIPRRRGPRLFFSLSEEIPEDGYAESTPVFQATRDVRLVAVSFSKSP
jgi:hypothetical protein